jgi:hypothetical protein
VALVSGLGVVSALIAVLFSSENRDFVADKMLLRRSYEGWLPFWAPDLNVAYYTDSHGQRVVDSYGYTFHYLSHLVSRLVAAILGEDFRALSATSLNTQNAVVAVVGIVGCWAVGLVCREIFQSRGAELAGFVGTFLLPLWMGHSWMNQKDVPFAVGFACATAAATLAANATRSGIVPRATVRELAVTTVLAVTLTFGTRPGLAILTLPLFVFGMWQLRQQSSKVHKPLIFSVLGASALVLVTNPASIPNPVGWVLNGIAVGRDFVGYSGDVLLDGAFVRSADLGSWYLIKSFVASFPFVALVGVVAGAIFLGIQVRQRMWSKVFPVCYHAIVVAAVVIGLSGNNYNAGRQFLFVVLGWQMVAVLGLWWLSTGVNRRWSRVLRLGIAALAAFVVVDHVSIFPYQYVYRNEIARRADDFANRGEFDYWGMAGRELVSAIPNQPGLVVYFGSGDRAGGGKYIPQSGQQFVPSGSTLLYDSDESTWKSAAGVAQVDYVPWLHYWPPRLDQPFRGSMSNCYIVHSAYAVMTPQRVLLGSLYKCR